MDTASQAILGIMYEGIEDFQPRTCASMMQVIQGDVDSAGQSLSLAAWQFYIEPGPELLDTFLRFPYASMNLDS